METQARDIHGGVPGVPSRGPRELQAAGLSTALPQGDRGFPPKSLTTTVLQTQGAWEEGVVAAPLPPRTTGPAPQLATHK